VAAATALPRPCRLECIAESNMDIRSAWVILVLAAVAAPQDRPQQERRSGNAIEVVLQARTLHGRHLQGGSTFADSSDRVFPIVQPLSRAVPVAYAVYPAQFLIFGVFLDRLRPEHQAELQMNLQNVTLIALDMATNVSPLQLSEPFEGLVTASFNVTLLQQAVEPAFAGPFLVGTFMQMAVPEAVFAVPNILDYTAAVTNCALARTTLGSTTVDYGIATTTTEESVLEVMADDGDDLEWWWWLVIMGIALFILLCCVFWLWRHCFPHPVDDKGLSFKSVVAEEPATANTSAQGGVRKDVAVSDPIAMEVTLEKNTKKEEEYQVEESLPRNPTDMRRQINQAQRKQRHIMTAEVQDAARLVELLSVNPTEPSMPSGTTRSLSQTQLNVPDHQKEEELEEMAKQLTEAELSRTLSSGAAPSLEKRRESAERAVEERETRKLLHIERRAAERELHAEAWRHQVEQVEAQRRQDKERIGHVDPVHHHDPDSDAEEERKKLNTAQKKRREGAEGQRLRAEEQKRFAEAETKRKQEEERALAEQESVKKEVKEEEEETSKTQQEQSKESTEEQATEAEEAMQGTREVDAVAPGQEQADAFAKREEEGDEAQTKREDQADEAPAKREEQADEAPAKREEQADEAPAKREEQADEAPAKREEQADEAKEEEQADAPEVEAEQAAHAASEEKQTEAKEDAGKEDEQDQAAQVQSLPEDTSPPSEYYSKWVLPSLPAGAWSHYNFEPFRQEHQAHAQELLQQSVEVDPPATDGATSVVAHAQACGVQPEMVWYLEVRRRRFHKVAELRRVLERCIEDLAVTSRPEPATLLTLWRQLEAKKATQLESMVHRAQTEGAVVLRELI